MIRLNDRSFHRIKQCLQTKSMIDNPRKFCQTDPNLNTFTTTLLALALLSGAPPTAAQRMYDSTGSQIGRVDGERDYDSSGRQIGRVDGTRIYDASGRQLGRLEGDRIYDSSGSQMGRIDGERLYSASGTSMGRIDGERIYDASGRQIGRADGLRRMQMVIYFYFFM
jgi:sporulation protein YlmC with PRC-barrel domain